MRSLLREVVAVLLGLGLVVAWAFFVGALQHAGRYRATRPDRVGLALISLAVAAYVVARHVPDGIRVGNPTFLQHVVGGGLPSAALVLYLLRSLPLPRHVVVEAAVLVATISTLGIANELLEYALTATDIYRVDSTDVWSDLWANLLGGVVAFTVLRPAVPFPTECRTRAS